MHTLSLNTQPRKVTNALQNLSKDIRTAKLLRRTEQGWTTRTIAVSILYMSVFHVGDLPWLFLLRSCVSTHVFFPAFFRCLFFQHAGKNVGKYVCVHLYKFFIDALIYVLCFDYVGLLLMMNMLTIVLSHLTCITPPIVQKALSTHERTERHRLDQIRTTETVLNWRHHWPKRLENGRFGWDELKLICSAEKISFQRGTTKSKTNMEEALDYHFLQEQQ